MACVLGLFPALLKPCRRCGWNSDGLQKGDPGSGLSAAAPSSVAAWESLSLSESPFSVRRRWRGQSGLPGPVQLRSLPRSDTPSSLPHPRGGAWAELTEQQPAWAPESFRVRPPQLDETQAGRQVLGGFSRTAHPPDHKNSQPSSLPLQRGPHGRCSGGDGMHTPLGLLLTPAGAALAARKETSSRWQ